MSRWNKEQNKKEKKSWIKSFRRNKKRDLVVAPLASGRRMTIARDVPREKNVEERTGE